MDDASDAQADKSEDSAVEQEEKEEEEEESGEEEEEEESEEEEDNDDVKKGDEEELTGDGTPAIEEKGASDEQSETIDKDSQEIDEESAAEVSFKDGNPASDDEEKDDDEFGDDANPSEPTPDDDQTDDDVRGEDAEDSANRQFFTGDDAEADNLEAGFGNNEVTQDEWKQPSPTTIGSGNVIGQAEPSSFSTEQGEVESTNTASIPTQRYDDDSVSEFGENSGFIGLMLASLVIALLARYIKRRRGAPEMAGYSRVIGDDRYGHSNSYAVNKKN